MSAFLSLSFLSFFFLFWFALTALLVQVANLADCIKVAIDFVSPENVARCERLTKEFREQNQSMVWKEDVLQLKAMMWFAWLSCSRQEAQ